MSNALVTVFFNNKTKQNKKSFIMLLLLGLIYKIS